MRWKQKEKGCTLSNFGWMSVNFFGLSLEVPYQQFHRILPCHISQTHGSTSATVSVLCMLLKVLYISKHLRGIEEQSRTDFIRAVNGQPVRRVEYRGNTRLRNDIINTAWERCENGIYNLEDFIKNVSHTPEQLLRNEIGEPNFIKCPVVFFDAPI
ncbi:uncharacterized protein LOC132935561 isoform X2 [Metopolophium dirhodum]|uniref:uncharacterized protein LOC132935561 isoform X2 n=1 Tax=Metopolophium dirhodum TaxID=44670 RepID=UPI0029901055|nr:uncharacterized protein LOC132935561 isoform X2 [Metopolophium dirhodum]